MKLHLIVGENSFLSLFLHSLNKMCKKQNVFFVAKNIWLCPHPSFNTGYKSVGNFLWNRIRKTNTLDFVSNFLLSQKNILWVRQNVMTAKIFLDLHNSAPHSFKGFTKNNSLLLELLSSLLHL